jgi:hypothetical protein
VVDTLASKDTVHRLQSVSIVGGFLDGQRFDPSDGLNCIIGARGFSGMPCAADAPASRLPEFLTIFLFAQAFWGAYKILTCLP